MTIHFDAPSLKSTDLEESELRPPTAQSLSGPILTRSKIVHSDPDRGITAGVWESEPGTSRWEFRDRGEFIHVVAGRMTVTQDGGDAVEISAGQTALFRIGWCGTWTVHERLRKTFLVLSEASGE
ncbi:DUF861 domain-containing protein [Rhodococcus sp. ABRD24]|uniref:cupin domain-containing protein n=1 Tax=Rhodococcus sp. ABRD24 TaxID=2507582 RepID=UPI00103F09B8|nr:cupin domain-containing protein [Rhodococcus sp. ABRD24]QBJ95584.1 DUF861 domain-containing protein [Rhodococcus sp. ABRD24]